MAQVGVSITKRVSFRDSTQEFANTYHYTYVGLNPSQSLAESIIDAIVALEKPIHSAEVSFVFARLWSSGGTIDQNAMIFEKVLTGTGTAATNTNMDRERAVLVQWSAGKDIRNRPVRLKKWFHCCGAFGNIAFAASHMQNAASLSVGMRDGIASLTAGFNPLIVNGSGMDLVAESGRPTDGPVKAHKFLEHHQLGDQWRA